MSTTQPHRNKISRRCLALLPDSVFTSAAPVALE